MTYAPEHEGALEDVREAGAHVTFEASAAEYDAETDTGGAVEVSSVSGFAFQTRGNPIRYQALGLIESSAPTLLFIPETYGELPVLGSSVTWAGAVHTVKSINPIAPDGTAIGAKVVISR